MTDLEQLAMDLRQRTQWQQTPVEMTEADYLEIARQAVRHLYVMTGRYTQYGPEDVPELDADEYEYVLTTAEVSFYRRVQSDVNRIIGYSTDAMTITNADKPYANLSQTIAELLARQRVLYYKMTRYTLL
ncbi:MAG TPA: hypothetical protein IAD24_07200 [Candidatus Aphodomorpha intestinavium]|uniref:Uncharacterized protein n=1 Tax=Candidatus Aphodomorpha intestinavium TaxID=2840672 RepID=A0A9D1SU83_9FIRM|nr:hypothetical protein [Candidatus Aphodomorpha intestinavium]